MRRDNERGDTELLSAYVDGVAELSLDERKRVDDLLARDPALRETARETRALLDELRALPAPGTEPDWSALERSIGDVVGKDVPVPWWQRTRWRFVVPGVALAMTAAMLALVLHDPMPRSAVDKPAPGVLPQSPASGTASETSGAAGGTSGAASGTIGGAASGMIDADELVASTPLWLDGTDLEVALEAAELFELDGALAWDLDAEALSATAELLPASDLGWIDALDGESLERVEKLLVQPRHDRGPT